MLFNSTATTCMWRVINKFHQPLAKEEEKRFATSSSAECRDAE